MNKKSADQDWMKQAKGALKRLRRAIEKASIEEIRAAILDDINSYTVPDADTAEAEAEAAYAYAYADADAAAEYTAFHKSLLLTRQLEELGESAALADAKAIESFISLYQKMGGWLRIIGWHETGPSKGKDGPQKNSQKPPPADTSPTNDWRKEINCAADSLCKITIIYPKEMEEELVKGIEKLPDTPFSFPLDCLIGKSERPNKHTKLVADLCNGLVQQRLTEECKRIIDDLAEDYAKEDPFPEAKSRGGIQAPFARMIYEHLERYRTLPSIMQKREELSEEVKQLCSYNELIDQLTVKSNSQAKKAQNEPKPDSEIKSEIESEISASGKSVSHYPKWEKFSEFVTHAETFQDERGITKRVATVKFYKQVWYTVKHSRPVSEKTFQLMKVDHSLADYFEWQKNWHLRAALLPPLSAHNDVIRQWVEAAFFWIICSDEWGYEKICEWEPVKDLIKSRGSPPAAVMSFLRRGFGVLAGKERKKK